ncbi:MAG TPA: hypothetical protein VGP22_06490, partial [Albitalea sp.]|nr:hypothetical protein [Albitalea sp.]
PMCWRIDQPLPAQALASLDRLEDPPAGQRLAVISEAAHWVQPDGRWNDWFERARLHRWAQRAFFTPTELRDWGLPEESVEAQEHAADPGFLALPLDESALDAWSHLLASGTLPAFSLTEPQRYPRLLATPGFDPFEAPAPAVLERLMAQLKLYLGDSGFRWLAAMAVPPLVRWELTLLLGRALFDHRAADIGDGWRVILARSYRRLARLPWLRGMDAKSGHRPPALPDWLRLRLLDELPPAVQEEVRHVVDNLLSKLRLGLGGDLPLGFETPPRPGSGQRVDLPDAPDSVYLGYLSGLTPRQLALRLPGGWSEWLRQQVTPDMDWATRWRRAAAAGREAAMAWLAQLAFRDGMPWAPRGAAIAVVAMAATVVFGAVVLRTEWNELPAGLRTALFHHETREVAVPSVPRVAARAIAPDGKAGLSMDRLGRVQLWETATGRVLARLRADRPLLSARFDAQGGRVLGCDSSGRVQAWSAHSGEPMPMPAPLPAAPAVVKLCDLGPDGLVRLIYDGDRFMLLAPGATEPRYFDATAKPWLSSNGRWMLMNTPSRDPAGALAVWDVRRAAMGSETLRGLEPSQIAFAGDTLATIERDRSSGTPALVLRDLATSGSFCLSLDEDAPASAQTAQTAQTAQIAQTALPNAPPPATPPAASATALAVSADARYAAVGRADGSVALWDVQRRERVASHALHPDAVQRLMLSGDGAVLWSVGAHGDSRLSRAWQPPSAEQPAALAAISAAGGRTAFATGDGRLTVRDSGSGAVVATVATGLRSPTLLAIHPDGHRVAVAAGPAVRQWPDIRRDALSNETVGDDVVLLRFSDDGRRLIAVTASGRLLAWPVDDGRLDAFTELSPPRPGVRVTAAAMNADGW